MGSEEKDEGQTISIKIRIPTKETIVENLAKMFPGIEVEIIEKKKEEESSSE
jgi:hypothetical protein